MITKEHLTTLSEIIDKGIDIGVVSAVGIAPGQDAGIGIVANAPLEAIVALGEPVRYWQVGDRRYPALHCIAFVVCGVTVVFSMSDEAHIEYLKATNNNV